MKPTLLDYAEQTDRRLCSILATGREERMKRCWFMKHRRSSTWRWYGATDPGAHTPPAWRPSDPQMY